MIRLVIEPYCHTCDAFKACVKTNVIFADGDKVVDTVVTCENKGLCDGIKRYLENERKHYEG